MKLFKPFFLSNLDFDICLLQLNVTNNNKEQNNANALRYIRHAYEKYHPKMIVLPEYFNTLFGYEYAKQNAEVFPNGETFNLLSNIAKELKFYLVAGSMPERDNQNQNYFYNTTAVWGPNGNLITKYRKIHLTDFNNDHDKKFFESEFMKNGNNFATFDVDGFKFGLGIGYDLSFSEFATYYRNQGVDVMIYAANYPYRHGEMQWENLNKSRAIDNQFYVASVSQTRNYNDNFAYYGHSMLVDPMGRVMSRAGDDEGIVYGYFDFDQLKKYRNYYNKFYHQNKRNDFYDTIFKNTSYNH